MLVLGFDTETTGLDVAKENIIELGAVLWDTKTGKPVEMMSRLTRTTAQPLDQKIIELTGITDEDLKTYGIQFGIAAREFENMLASAQAIVAHNGNMFDKPMMISNVERHCAAEPLGVSLTAKLKESLWIDTTCDIEFPPEIQTRKLTHLAAEHGFLNPFSHRAVFDVLTMLKIAQRYDWDQIVRYAKTPSIVLIANTSYEQRELAKKLNYRWNGDKKVWTKSVKQFQLDAEKDAAKLAGFTIKVGKSEN